MGQRGVRFEPTNIIRDEQDTEDSSTIESDMNLLNVKPFAAYAVMLVLAGSAVAQVVPPPTITKAFGAPTIALGDTTSLTFVISNPGAGTLTGVAFTDTLPTGLVLGNSLSASCTPGSGIGPFVANALSQNVSFQGIFLLPGGSCTLSLFVVGTAMGVQNNTTSVITSSQSAAGATSNTATVTVVAPPVLTKAFTAASIVLNGSTTLTFTVFNPNPTVALNGITFTDTLPPGLAIAAVPGVVTNCGVAPTLTPPSVIALTGATLAAGASCSFSVNVTGIADGTLSNVTSTVTTTNGGTGLAASAALVVGNVFQVRYFSNLGIGDSVFNITNTGESSTTASPTQNGNICVNVYSFSPDEQLSACCSCLLTPNALANNSARSDLITNTLTPDAPNALVVKLVASTGTLTASGTTICNAATVATGTNVLTTGLAAWGTTLHALPARPGSPATTYGVTETPFTAGSLSVAELTRITTLCNFIEANGSGFGICRSCRFGALGGEKF